MSAPARGRLPALVIEWEDRTSGTRFRVGRLIYGEDGWTFQYGYRVDAASSAGFPGLGGFPKVKDPVEAEDSGDVRWQWQVFASATLFPAIARRVPDLRRSDVSGLLADYRDRPEEEQKYWYLRLQKGRLAADPFQFSVPGGEDGPAHDQLDEPIRRELRRVVGECREILFEDFARQLEGRYGINRRKGTIDPVERLRLDALERETRDAIVAAIEHAEVTRDCTRAEAIEDYLREAAFTALNRLAALKLMEHPGREVIRESIGGGRQSRGLRQFQMVCPEVVAGSGDGGYRRYLELLADDLAVEMELLWDRTSPASALFPSPGALDRLVALLNEDTVASAWGHDETIGWVYQYFTPPEDREQARKQSPAPRNSWELAFRNQFYTPQYVVEFLTDNTLGRLWAEMRRGRTRLDERCRYRLRAGGEKPRAPKDPRDIRVLDPACGSGHFLLYAFDLLRLIYEEAWEDGALPPSTATGRALRADYPDRERLLRALPGLILRWNLHGVDIDLRATQIATLALWLRSQRLAAELGVGTAREPISRVNVVCAEPMPGERAMFDEFLTTLDPPLLRAIARHVWDTLGLASEAGSLLKVEKALRDVIAEARRQSATAPAPQQIGLFGDVPQGQQLALDLSGITDSAFWDRAEGRIIEALQAWAERASSGNGVRRRIFAEDGAQGFRFVDLFLRPYDVVLMNPPFGDASLGARGYIETQYPRTKNDLYAAFVERGLELLHPGGYLGAITSRTGFFLRSFAPWRREILLGEGRLVAMADLGYGVLDTAMVETAAYVIERVAPMDPRARGASS